MLFIAFTCTLIFELWIIEKTQRGGGDPAFTVVEELKEEETGRVEEINEQRLKQR